MDETMTDRDILLRFIYLVTDYLFYDATIYKDRVSIYNVANECLAVIYVDAFDPDGIEIFSGCVNGSVEVINVMNVVIDLIRMVFDLHRHPEDVIKRLVDLNV